MLGYYIFLISIMFTSSIAFLAVRVLLYKRSSQFYLKKDFSLPMGAEELELLETTPTIKLRKRPRLVVLQGGLSKEPKVANIS